MVYIPSLIEVEQSDPYPQEVVHFVQDCREKAIQILGKASPKLAVLVGPCSIHRPEEAIEYAIRLKQIEIQVPHLFLVMRVFLEKPRTRSGWKGFVYDPHLDGSHHFVEGIKEGRKLLIKLNQLGVPCATELLDPLITPYFEKLITWGMIGARTSASQPHRQLASGMPFPIGFKNAIHGELDSAIDGIISARISHTHLSINPEGKIFGKQTKGNPFTHLVLRGSAKGPNYDASAVKEAISLLKNQGLEQNILIDCAHGNSQKNHRLQASVLQNVIEQKKSSSKEIIGLMVESHLREGKQQLGAFPLEAGISITDACIGWEETKELLLFANQELGEIAMSSVQR